MKDLVIVGSGGFASEVAWLVERINHVLPTWDLKGFVDNDVDKHGVIGDDDFIMRCERELYVAIAIGTSVTRERLYAKYRRNPHIRFANLMDPSVIASDRNEYGEGNIICAGTILTVDVKIGNCNIINLDCTVGHGATIKDFVTISPSVNVSGNALIDSGCNVGTGTQIIQGVTIGRNAIVGAGAVVNRNLPGDCTAVGIPAKVIKIHPQVD